MKHVLSWFQAALNPDRWNVAGVSCGVLTVWHAFVLQQTGNPYHCGGACDRDAAASLLAFCSRDYAGGRKMFQGPFYRARVMRKINRALKRADWEEIHAAVTEYVQTCTRTPAHKQVVSTVKGAATSKRAAAPMGWILVSYLSGGDPSKVEAAWNTPYATARCLFDAHRDIEGDDDSLETPDEEERFDNFKGGE